MLLFLKTHGATPFKVLLCFFVLSLNLIWGIEARAQSTDPFKVNLLPPSPEASALAKYADIPISLYSGTISASIPLYDIKERDLSLNIGLSYHASGIKVGEVASRVGIGWTLDAGGVITRATRGGWPDEFTPAGFLSQAQHHTISDFALGNIPAAQQWEWYNDMANGCIDMEPDLFYFNIGGYSGKFMFNWDGQIELASASNLKIMTLGMIPGSNAFIPGWKIITEDGTVFIFQEVETTKIVSSTGLNPSCTLPVQAANISSAWYLSEIRSKHGQSSIYLQYEPYTQNIPSWSMETQTHNIGLGPATPNRQLITTRTNGKQLRKIVTSSGRTTVDFLSGHARTDVDGSCFVLGQILVKNSRGRIIKDFRLEQDQTTGRNTLRKISEWSPATSKPPYVFDYYQGSLPVTTSFAQDHWGYLNNNPYQTMIPPATTTRPTETNPITLGGANREPSFQSMLTGMLKKITYPTGGVDMFTYEMNDYSFEQDREIIKEITIPKNYNQSAPDYNTAPGATDIHEVDFLLLSKTDIHINANFYFGLTFGGSGFSPTLSIKNKTTSQVIYYISPGGVAPDVKSFDETLVKVPPGLYTFTLKGRMPLQVGNYNYADASVSYNEGTGNFVTEIRQGGGLRISKLERCYGNGNPCTVKRYDYSVMENGQLKSTGSLLQEPDNYAEWQLYTKSLTQYTFTTENKFHRVSQNLSDLGTTQGSHVGYSSVTVIQGLNGENGKTVYRYTSPREFPDFIHYENPRPPADSYDYSRGLLLTQEDFDRDGSLLKKAENEYMYFHQEIPAIKVGWELPGVGLVGELYINRYSLGNYSNFIGYTRVKRTHETEYRGGLSFKKSQKFVYNENRSHRQLISTSTIDALNDSIFTQLTYPQDYDAGNTALDLLVDHHQVSSVVEKLVWKKTDGPDSKTLLLSGLKTDHNIYNNVNVLPSLLKSARISSPIVFDGSPLIAVQNLYEDRLQYNRYDVYENLLEHSMPNGQVTSYVWGDQGSDLIAKVDNAKATQIFHTSFEDTQASTSQQKTGSKSRLLNNSSFTIPVQSLPSVAGNYVLTYWIKEGSSWQYQEKELLNYQLGNPISTEIITGYLDEVRLFPKGAMMTTFTYEPLVGTTSITDYNNRTIYFEYDDFNRLKAKKDQDGNILETYDYKFLEEVPFEGQN
jgi:YD repeat-containing protein